MNSKIKNTGYIIKKIMIMPLVMYVAIKDS